MQKILTAEEMREVDRLTTEKYGIPSILLMENAAHATARVIAEKLGGSVEGKSFLILCGKGNNGGDGAALARILWTQGADVNVHLFGKVENTDGDARKNFAILKSLFEEVSSGKTAYQSFISFSEVDDYERWRRFARVGSEKTILVDAIFGTGLNGAIREPLSKIFKNQLLDDREFRESSELLVSLDISSGLDSDSSEILGDTVESDLTISFTAPKIANILPPASNYNGEVHIVDIGSPKELLENSPSRTFVTERDDAQIWMYQTKFCDDSYKNKRGNVFLIAGSKRYSGAAVLAGNGAMRSGAGVVTIATSESGLHSVAEKVLSEVMVLGVAETDSGSISEAAFGDIKRFSEKADVVAIGCGLTSNEESTKDFVREVVTKRKTPIVIDADGLNSLSPFDIEGDAVLPIVLTPHEGEFLRLLGTTDKWSIKDRVGTVRDFAVKHNVILVLKGERTLIAEPSGKVVINPTGNSGLGKAGNGDNLTGIITGFIAQSVKAKVDIFDGVVAAVYVAGLAGDIAKRKFGKRVMLASDVRDCLVEAYKEIQDA